VSLSTVSACFREYLKLRSAKQPTGEYVLALQKFLQQEHRETTKSMILTEVSVLAWFLLSIMLWLSSSDSYF